MMLKQTTKKAAAAVGDLITPIVNGATAVRKNTESNLQKKTKSDSEKTGQSVGLVRYLRLEPALFWPSLGLSVPPLSSNFPPCSHRLR